MDLEGFSSELFIIWQVVWAALSGHVPKYGDVSEPPHPPLSHNAFDSVISSTVPRQTLCVDDMAQGKQKFKAQRPGGGKKQNQKQKGPKKGGKNVSEQCLEWHFVIS